MKSYRLLNLNDVGSRLQNVIALASEEAKKSNKAQRHGAVLFRSSTIVSTGHNKHRDASWVRKRHTRKFPMCTMHAEINCMHNVPRKKIIGKDIAVVRVNPSEVLVNSRPCDSCIFEMTRKGVRRCFFSLGGGLLGLLYLQK